MKKAIVLILALSMVFALCACGAKKEAEAYTPVDTDTVAVGAVIIARDDVPEDEIYDFVSAIFENVDAISEQHGKGKELDLNFAASVASVPYHPGAAKYFAESGAIDSFSVVASLYMEQVQIVTTDAKIASVADLKGKTVSIGAVGSGVYFNAVDVLTAYGLDPEKDIKPVYQSFGDSADSLKDGKIDAAFIVAGAPTNAITDLATAGNVYLVAIDKEHSDKLLAASPFYSTFTIPAGTY